MANYGSELECRDGRWLAFIWWGAALKSESKGRVWSVRTSVGWRGVPTARAGGHEKGRTAAGRRSLSESAVSVMSIRARDSASVTADRSQ